MRSYSRVEAYLERVERANFSHPGSYVFYSGGQWGGNRLLAESYALANAGTTLEMTRIGVFLENERLFGEQLDGIGLPRANHEKLHPDQLELPWTESEAIHVWHLASRRYAEQAHGHVVAFVAPDRHDSTFFRIELPSLLCNPNVDTINRYPRSQLLHALDDRLGPTGLNPESYESLLTEGLRDMLVKVGTQQPLIALEPRLSESPSF